MRLVRRLTDFRSDYRDSISLWILLLFQCRWHSSLAAYRLFEIALRRHKYCLAGGSAAYLFIVSVMCQMFFRWSVFCLLRREILIEDLFNWQNVCELLIFVQLSVCCFVLAHGPTILGNDSLLLTELLKAKMSFLVTVAMRVLLKDINS